MNRESYIKLMDWGRSSQKRIRWIYYGNKFVTGAIYIAYPALLLVLLLQKSEQTLRVFFVPGISFILVSLFRHLYNEKRPYVTYDYPSVIQKNDTGNSMPSRHVFSAYMIAVAFYVVNPLYSIPVFLCAVAMSIGRVLAGVHYPKDVIVGAILGIGLGIVGFYLI